MPGFVPSPETLKILVHWTIHGRPQLNVLHAHFPTVGPPDPAAVQRIRNTVAASIVTDGYVTVLAPTTSFAQIGMIDLRNEGVPEVISTGTPVPGTSTAAAFPDQVSLVLTERTAKTGRSHRGRIYTLGWGNGNIDATGQAIQGSADAAVAWYNSLRSAMGTEGWTLAIRSPALPERPSKPGGLLPAKAYEITNVTLIEARDLIFDTNRRRTDILRR